MNTSLHWASTWLTGRLWQQCAALGRRKSRSIAQHGTTICQCPCPPWLIQAAVSQRRTHLILDGFSQTASTDLQEESPNPNRQHRRKNTIPLYSTNSLPFSTGVIYVSNGVFVGLTKKNCAWNLKTNPVSAILYHNSKIIKLYFDRKQLGCGM